MARLHSLFLVTDPDQSHLCSRIQVTPPPCTLNPAPCTLNPEPCTLNPAPWTLNPET